MQTGQLSVSAELGGKISVPGGWFVHLPSAAAPAGQRVWVLPGTAVGFERVTAENLHPRGTGTSMSRERRGQLGVARKRRLKHDLGCCAAT